MHAFRRCGGVYLTRKESAKVTIRSVFSIPSGNSPVVPFTKCLPRNQPSPKSSSRSISSIRSPRDRVNSSGLLATKSSAAFCMSVDSSSVAMRIQHEAPHLRTTFEQDKGSSLTDCKQYIPRAGLFHVRPGRHAAECARSPEAVVTAPGRNSAIWINSAGGASPWDVAVGGLEDEDGLSDVPARRR